MKCPQKEGFTLIEMLVVILIIGALASVTILTLNPAKLRARARYTTVRENMRQVCQAANICAVEADGDPLSECNVYDKLEARRPEGDSGSGGWIEVYNGTLHHDPGSRSWGYYGFLYRDSSGDNAKQSTEEGCIFACPYDAPMGAFVFTTGQYINGGTSDLVTEDNWSANCPVD